MSDSAKENQIQFLNGNGEMAALTRAKDWSTTPVGPIATWPQSLRTTLGIILNAKYPMFLWWGPQLTCFYNDAYRPSLGKDGKHPSILGQPAETAWVEIWAIIKPLIDQVLAGGEATWSEDQLIPIFRNGKIEDVYWTFSYSPVHDETGSIAGVLVTCNETTEKVNAERSHQQLFKEMEKQVQERTAQLEQKNEELKKKNVELQSFAYVASHDLQEPLRKIQTFSTRIVDKEAQNLSDNGKDAFSRIQGAASRMQVLIDDLLTYSRTNTTERVFQPVSVNNVLEQVKTELKDDIQHTGAVIEASDLKETNAISFQLRQLLLNLLSNSLKFRNPEVPLHISIKARFIEGHKVNIDMLSAEKTYYHLTVTDNGIGFMQQYSQRIFEIFQRLHGKDEYKGTGIGLAIVKRIVENHNGVITATGIPDAGATFDIYLPVNQ